MSNGEYHAKQTIKIQMDNIKGKLSNGHRSDPETHGAALLLLLQIMEPIFDAKFVTEERLKEIHEASRKRVIGWPGAAAILGTMGMLCGTALKLFL